MKVDGVILAAGESRRMGAIKALLPFQDVSFLDRLILLFSGCCDSVTVVLGAHAEQVRAGAAQAAAARFVVNHDYARGQLSSLQAGLRAIDQIGHVLVTLVDHPAVAPSTLAALVAVPAPVRVPRYQGRNGHPILISREVAAELMALDPGSTAKQVIHAHAAQTNFVDVDDPGVLQDIDDPAAYAELLRSAECA